MYVSRRIGVIAWIAATILSVAASTAAVAAVRAQVTDRPDIVSLATLRRATSTTTAEAVPAPTFVIDDMPTTTTTAPSTTSTTRRPAIVATPGTTVETTSTTAPPRSEPSVPVGGVETRTFRGGTVIVSYDGATLTLVEAIPEEGYELSIEEQNDRIIAIRFVREGRSSGYVAQIVNGRLQIRVID